MQVVPTKNATSKQRQPAFTKAKKNKAEIASRPASDAQALPTRRVEKPIASKFKIAALYVASGSTGFLIPFAQAASKVLSRAAACRRAALASEPEGKDSDVSSDDSSEVASSETTSSWTASSMPSSDSTTSSWTASSMPSSESEDEEAGKALASDSDSSETASSMPSSDESQEQTEAPTQVRKLVRRHVRPGSQPVHHAEHAATAAQDLVAQDL